MTTLEADPRGALLLGADPDIGDDLLHGSATHNTALLFAGTSLDWARALFAALARKRPQGRLTVRQRASALAEWPKVSP